MENFLITPSLINSFSYYMSEYGKREDFLKTLSREKFEPSDAMQKGIDFEDSIKSYCESNKDEADKCIREVGDIVEGGVWQATVQKILTIGNTEYLLYGRCDVIKENFIYDIKFTSNYEVGKFSNSAQHLIYMYCTRLSDFAYLISNGKEWWREDYKASKDIENEVKSRIAEFRDYLDVDREARALFLTKWKSQCSSGKILFD